MKSKLLQLDREELVDLCRKMTPTERLLACYNHSKLVNQIYRAGVQARRKLSTTPKSSQNSKNI